MADVARTAVSISLLLGDGLGGGGYRILKTKKTEQDGKPGRLDGEVSGVETVDIAPCTQTRVDGVSMA